MGRVCVLTVGLLALAIMCRPAAAQEQARIGIGYGLAFLPTYVCEDLKLVEKYAREQHLDVRAAYQRFPGAGPVRDAIASGEIEMGPFGTAPLLAAWEKATGTPQQILAVSGITTMPLKLVTNQAAIASIADFRPTDRIAMPSLSAPQMLLLELQSEKIFKQYDRLRGQVVAMPPSDAVAALVEGGSPVTAYFASPPYTAIALHSAGVHGVLTSADVMNGKASFLIMGATRSYIEAHPLMPAVIEKAMDEAARIIRDDPRRAAQIYLTHEPSKTLGAAAIEAVLRDIGGEFGSAVYGVQTVADFMGRHDQLKKPPQSWKEIVAPALQNSPSG